PWDPNGYGPKRWATYTSVCSRVSAGTAFPGDEGSHYTLNTGEAFAEAYRALEESRGVYPWAHLPLVVDPSFTPDAGSEGAALADVQQPWNGPSSATWEGRFTAPTVKLNAAVGRTVSLKTGASVAGEILARRTHDIAGRRRAGEEPRAWHLRDRRPRRVETGRLPSHRAGSRPEDGGARPRPGQLEARPEAGHAPPPLGHSSGA